MWLSGTTARARQFSSIAQEENRGPRLSLNQALKLLGGGYGVEAPGVAGQGH